MYDVQYPVKFPSTLSIFEWKETGCTHALAWPFLQKYLIPMSAGPLRYHVTGPDMLRWHSLTFKKTIQKVARLIYTHVNYNANGYYLYCLYNTCRIASERTLAIGLMRCVNIPEFIERISFILHS